MATIDGSGARIKTLTEYLEEIKSAYKAIDDGWNINPETPDGNAIEIWAERFANADEAIVSAYQSIDRRTAVDQQLDRIGDLNLLERQAGTFSTVTLSLTGTAGSVIPAGTEFRSTETGTLWASDTDVTLDGSGVATVNATCTTAGSEPAAVDTITEIATPVLGLSSVTNPDAASLGADRESDRAFRARQFRSVGRPGNNQVESMFAAVADVAGVTRVRIAENFDPSTDSDGLNPHSLAVIADGGDVDDVARAIAARKNPGTNLNRDNAALDNEVTVPTTTPQGNPLTVTFFRPLLTTIFVEVEIDGEYDAEQIKDAIVDYAQGDLFNGGEGFDRDGFAIGDTVPVGKIYTPVNKVLGDDSFATRIEIGTDPGALGIAPINVGFNGLAVFEASAITVVSAP